MLTRGRETYTILSEECLGSFLHAKFPSNCPKPVCYGGKLKERQKDNETIIVYRRYRVELTKEERIKLHYALREAGHRGYLIMRGER